MPACQSWAALSQRDTGTAGSLQVRLLFLLTTCRDLCLGANTRLLSGNDQSAPICHSLTSSVQHRQVSDFGFEL
jgi:hypothetical protein